ncbi:MAG: hypothetical protein AAB521_04060 [Patescibacteria group bacterium]|mgnify:CR=1 FL=1
MDSFFSQNLNWIVLFVSAMWLRILLMFFMGLVLALILTFRFPSRYIKNKTKIRAIIFITTVFLIGYFLIPKGIWKAKINLSPPQTLVATYSFSQGSITQSDSVILLYKSSSSFEDIINFYVEKLKENKLCLGIQSLYKNERCLPKEAIIALGINKDWAINKIDSDGDHKGLGWGYFAIFEKGGSRVIQIYLY